MRSCRASYTLLVFHLHLSLLTLHHGTFVSLVLAHPAADTPPDVQASGVAVNPSLLDTFQELKLGKKYKYIIFSLSPDLKEIIVAKTSTDTNYESFIADLPESECRWAVYDFEYDAEGGAGKRNKLTFISWCVVVR